MGVVFARLHQADKLIKGSAWPRPRYHALDRLRAAMLRRTHAGFGRRLPPHAGDSRVSDFPPDGGT
jgi:hypothetical protein